MKATNKQEPAGKVTASLVSVVGLVLVWGIVWANLPSKDELLSAQSQPRAAAVPVVPELDLTILEFLQPLHSVRCTRRELGDQLERP